MWALNLSKAIPKQTPQKKWSLCDHVKTLSSQTPHLAGGRPTLSKTPIKSSFALLAFFYDKSVDEFYINGFAMPEYYKIDPIWGGIES